jgi:hypothetical protein
MSRALCAARRPSSSAALSARDVPARRRRVEGTEYLRREALVRACAEPSRPQKQPDAEARMPHRRLTGGLAGASQMEGIRRLISARSVDRGDHHSADDAPGGLAGVELGIRLLVDHREPLVRMRTALYNDLLCDATSLPFVLRAVRRPCTTCGPSRTFPVCVGRAWRPGRRAVRTGGTCAGRRRSCRRGSRRWAHRVQARRTHRGPRRRDAGWGSLPMADRKASWSAPNITARERTVRHHSSPPPFTGDDDR